MSRMEKDLKEGRQMQSEEQKQKKKERDAKIRELYQKGMRKSKIAETLGISFTCVTDSLNGGKKYPRSEYDRWDSDLIAIWKADWDETCKALRREMNPGGEESNGENQEQASM